MLSKQLRRLQKESLKITRVKKRETNALFAIVNLKILTKSQSLLAQQNISSIPNASRNGSRLT